MRLLPPPDIVVSIYPSHTASPSIPYPFSLPPWVMEHCVKNSLRVLLALFSPSEEESKTLEKHPPSPQPLPNQWAPINVWGKFFCYAPGAKRTHGKNDDDEKGEKMLFILLIYTAEATPKKPLFLHLSTGLPDGKEFFGVFWGVPMRLAAIDRREEQRNH